MYFDYMLLFRKPRDILALNHSNRQLLLDLQFGQAGGDSSSLLHTAAWLNRGLEGPLCRCFTAGKLVLPVDQELSWSFGCGVLLFLHGLTWASFLPMAWFSRVCPKENQEKVVLPCMTYP